MAVDFVDAQRIVREYLLDRWTAANGTLLIAGGGYKDATHWRVVAGTDPDIEAEAPLPPGETAYLVDRSSGALEVVPVAGNDARLGEMLPWGAV